MVNVASKKEGRHFLLLECTELLLCILLLQVVWHFQIYPLAILHPSENLIITTIVKIYSIEHNQERNESSIVHTTQTTTVVEPMIKKEDSALKTKYHSHNPQSMRQSNTIYQLNGHRRTKTRNLIYGFTLFFTLAAIDVVGVDAGMLVD